MRTRRLQPDAGAWRSLGDCLVGKSVPVVEAYDRAGSDYCVFN